MDGWSPVPCASLAATAPTWWQSTGRGWSPGHEQWEIDFWGGLWAGCRTRLGLMHQTIMVVEKVSWKLRVHFGFTFFYKKCFSVHSLESIPAFWSGGLVPWVWCELPKSQASAQGLGIPRREGTARLASWELKGLRKYSEQRCSKTSHRWNFLLGGEYLEEHLNTLSVWLVSHYSSFYCTCFVFFKLVSLT